MTGNTDNSDETSANLEASLRRTQIAAEASPEVLANSRHDPALYRAVALKFTIVAAPVILVLLVFTVLVVTGVIEPDWSNLNPFGGRS